MARTLQNILQDANAYLALDNSTPTGTDLATWTNYANQAVFDAAALDQFNEFNSIQFVATSGGINNLATNASISLASNFRETVLAQVNLGGGVYQSYEEIKPQDRFSKQTTDQYFYVLGNPVQGYTAVFNQLTANATLSIDYQRYPSGFATLTDVCELPDDTYVTAKIVSYVLQARSDDRFPTAEANAQRKLAEMTGRGSKTPGGGINTTPKLGTYRIGT
jgi:hypothetical protein